MVKLSMKTEDSRHLKILLGIAILSLSFALPFVPVSAPITAVNIDDDDVQVGDVITVWGPDAQFAAGYPVKGYWDIAVGPEAWLLNTTTVNSDGSYLLEITVPDTVTGFHWIWVEDTFRQRWFRSSVITVNVGARDMIFNPTSGQVGTSVAIIGIGFEPGLYNAMFGSIPIVTNGVVSGDGTLTDEFIVPNVDSGSYDVTVEDSANNELSRTFTVTSDPITAINIDDDDVQVGDVITVWGPARQVVSGAIIEGYWDKITDAWLLDTTTGNPDGSYSFEITVPDTDTGSHWIWVEFTSTQVTWSSKITVHAPLPPLPNIESCNPEGIKKDTFDLTEDIYVNGGGFMSNAIYDIYVVDDITWTDGMIIPSRVPGTEWVVASDIDGSMGPINVWSSPLEIGKYDIVIDGNGNGKYDEDIDAIDDEDIEVTGGFFVIPELPLGTITILATSILALMLHKKRFRVYSYSSPSR